MTEMLRLPADGPALATEVDATDVLGEAFGRGADVVVVPPVADWIREANRGREIWFVADEDELARRLTGSGAA